LSDPLNQKIASRSAMSIWQMGCQSSWIFQRIFPKSGKQIHSWHGFVKYFFDVRFGTGTFSCRYLFAPQKGP